ncbi:E3 ubiquitin-protein ligase MIB2-like isoform X2 [Dreissena polymorpha]|uniref:E3 ubiquitin-protein ligase MIB2-like isoform X2 n=1 Tax=Dreissena polymorpha TaxID=45954 RepID=UPI002263D742|nr:E3 ubiquitin-protein ligase MIB2-like isoform X2 [Dreissena polymorpha]
MGILWSCQDCPGIYLCNTCYSCDQHDIRHTFKRLDDPVAEGYAVARRSISYKVRSSGLFVGAKVKHLGENGDDHRNRGTVAACVPYNEHEALQNAVKVVWSNNETSVCRPGVEVICIEEMPGLYYYRDHLPVLGQNTYDAENKQPAYKVTQQTNVIESENTLPVDEGYQLRYRPHADAHRDPDSKHVGDRVRIIDNAAYLRSVLKENWSDDMTTVIGEVGKITHKYTDGFLEVNFGNKAWMFLPACFESYTDQNQAASITKSSTQSKDTTNKTRHMHQSTSSAHLETEEDLNKLFELFSTVFSSLSDVPPTFLIDAVAANHCALVFVTAARCPHLVNGIHQTFTALMLACQKGYKDAVQILLTARADANIAGENGMTALMLAIIHGHAEIAILLIQRGADPNLKDKKGRNAMIIAAYKLETTVIKELIARNADLNEQDEQGNTALHVSIIANNAVSILDMVQCKRVNVLIRNKNRQTPMILAAIKNDVKTIEVIINRCPANKYPDVANEALQAAIFNNNTDVVRLLIQLGVDVNRLDEKLTISLHYACLLGQFDISKLLAQAGACVNKQSVDGVTPLHLCIAKSSPNCNVDETEEVRTLNNTPEKIRERTDLACYLVKHGADMLIRDANGNTPLTFCTEENMLTSIKRSARVQYVVFRFF